MSEWAYNPITGNLDRIGEGSGPGGDITISGDSGSPIVGDIFAFVGQEAGASNTPIVDVDTSTGDVVIANNAWMTPYVIDPSTTAGLKGTYQTIQTALNAAVVDGMTYTNPKIFLIRAGSYNENLAIPGGAYFLSFTISGDTQTFIQPTTINGNHTIADIGVIYSKGISWVGGSSNIFTSGATFLLFLAEDSTFSTTGLAKYVNSTVASSIEFRDCAFGGATDNHSQKFSFASGTMLFENCQLNGAGMAAGGIVTAKNTTGIGKTTFSAGVPIFSYSTLTSDTANIVMNSAATSGSVSNCEFVSNSGTNFGIEGTHANLIRTFNCKIREGFTGPLGFQDPALQVNNGALEQFGNVINSSARTAIDFNATGYEGYIGVTDTSSARSVVIKALAKNYCVYVADETGGAATNNITVTVLGSGTINGNSSDIINSNFGGKLYFSQDGVNFIILSINQATGGSNTPSPWINVSGTSQAMAIWNKYVANNASLVTFTLPTSAGFGTEIEVMGNGAGGWIISQAVGQSITYGNTSTTIGVSGSLASDNVKDAVRLVCVVANTTWNVASSQGNITVS